jgi:hypothetical protein
MALQRCGWTLRRTPTLLGAAHPLARATFFHPRCNLQKIGCKQV